MLDRMQSTLSSRWNRFEKILTSSICVHDGPVNGDSIADHHMHSVTDEMSGDSMT
ncbi:hypothetical protein IMCC3135_09740 [Granulosicoccus antarcticus IMCC3135]|uniref:Uncharacterized protein n=1 Tax=Granulosicoccus antarcticus IMCC3135 TaxID=1192854 RepID=A0A2Z2NY24_9GAMM|nr:hypothetical protein IMCC3135_09740 [Granulosicoccus antarcticus IMCC3135]